jgi:hypothetical protein
VWADREPLNSDVKLDTSEDMSNPRDLVTLDTAMNNGDTKTLYVQSSANPSADGGGTFRLAARADLA